MTANNYKLYYVIYMCVCMYSMHHINNNAIFSHSGPCMTLVLTKGDTGEGVVDDIRNFIGPPDVEKAKEESPERLRLSYSS